jgi:glyoxylase I family protein
VSAADAPAARGFHHLAIQVRDLGVVERFYVETLGLAVLRRWPSRDGAGERSVWLDAGDGAFLALERVTDGPTTHEDPARATRPGLHLIAIAIARTARDAWLARLADTGVAVEARTAFTLYVRDPEGNRVGLSHWPDEAVG